MKTVMNLLELADNFLSRLLQVNRDETEPGFIRAFPYLLLLRWLIFMAIGFRFWLHMSDYASSELTPIALVLGVAAVINLVATLITLQPRLRQNTNIQGGFIVADVLLISFFYYWTRNTQSDFFLFFYLPMFSAAEYLGGVLIRWVSLLISLVFISVVVLTAPLEHPPASLLSVSEKVLFPRIVFFFVVVVTSSLLLQSERRQRKNTNQRKAEVQTLLDIKSEDDQLFDIDEIMQKNLREAVKVTGMYGGFISLIDFETKQHRLGPCIPSTLIRADCYQETLHFIDGQVREAQSFSKVVSVRGNAPLAAVCDPQVSSIVCMPIKAHDTVLGAIAIANAGDNRLDSAIEQFLKTLASQMGSEIERIRLTNALSEIGQVTTSVTQLDRELDSILDELTTDLKFEYVIISLVDDYRQVIETIRGSNIPAGWIKRSRYNLEDKDILADVVRTQKTELLDHWDERLNPDIYQRFGHDRLARVFTPIIFEGKPVGTIEAGCQKEHQAEVLSGENIACVKQIAARHAETVAKTRSYVMMELIARQAVHIIGADSASIHVFQGDGQQILLAGAGRSTKEFLHQFPPRSQGIGQRAMRMQRTIIIDDPAQLRNEHLRLYDEGVRALAAFPLRLSEDLRGILYIHFWRDHKYSQAELELENVFARQIEVVIQNHWFLRNVAEYTQSRWALTHFMSIVQSLSSTFDLNRVLDEIARNVLYMFDADNLTLYQFSEKEQDFAYPPVMAGNFQDYGAMVTPVKKKDVLWRIISDPHNLFITDVRENLILRKPPAATSGRLGFIDREGIRSSAVLILREGESGEIIGLMFVNYRNRRDFSLEDQRIFSEMASSAALAIRTARLYKQVQSDLNRREKELSAIQDIERVISVSSAKLDVNSLLELMLVSGVEITGADHGELLLFNRWNRNLELRLQMQKGETDNFTAGESRLHSPEEGIIGWAISNRKSVLVPYVFSEPWKSIYKQVWPDTKSELVVPIFDDNSLLAVLNMEHSEKDFFNDNDRKLLETLALQSTIAIYSVKLNQELNDAIKRLHSLAVVSATIQNPSVDLDTSLQLLMTGISAGEGIGCSRAMLFLFNEDMTRLEGKMAIGSQTRQDADLIWKNMNLEAGAMNKSENEMLNYRLNQAMAFRAGIKEGKWPDSPLSLAVQKVSIRVYVHPDGVITCSDEPEMNALFRCLSQKSPVTVGMQQEDSLRILVEQDPEDSGPHYAFACVPIQGKDRAIGVIAVDNRFLNKEIPDGAIKALDVYARVVAMVIENADLRKELNEEQRVKHTQEFAAETAHTIGTRINILENQLTRLSTSLAELRAPGDDGHTEATQLVEKMQNSIDKTKFIFSDFRRYGKPADLKRVKMDINQAVKEFLSEVRHSYDQILVGDCLDHPIYILGDSGELSNAFHELVKNAHEAVKGSTLRPPQIVIRLEEEEGPGDQQTAIITFSNTGPWIKSEDKKKIFEPFFSTKSQGSGLGLAIVKRTIVGHHGTIEENGEQDQGARFVIRLPVTDDKMRAKEGEGNG